MAVFSDAFTDTAGTALSSHTPDVGTGWGGTGHVITDANRARNNAGGFAYNWVLDDPPGTEYSISGKFRVLSFTAATLWDGAIVRGVAASTRYGIQFRLESTGTDLTPILTIHRAGDTFPGDVLDTVGGTPGFSTGADYTFEMVVTDGPDTDDSDVDVFVVRVSDGNYLKNDGTWQAGRIACLSGSYDHSFYVANGVPLDAAPGKAGLVGNQASSNSTAVHFDDFSLSAAGGSSFTIDPTSILTGATGELVTATGTGTSWTGSPFSIVSGPTGTSIASQSVLSTTSAEITFNTGSEAGTIVLTDGVTTFEIAVTAGTIALTSPTVGQHFRRIGYDSYGRGGTANIPVSGTYTGNPTTIVGSLDNFATSVVIDDAPAGGTFSGVISDVVPYGYPIKVAFGNDSGVNASVANVTVGAVLAAWGQSNNQGGPTGLYTFGQAGGFDCKLFDETNGWQSITAAGSMWQADVAALSAHLQMPVALLLKYEGGTNYSQWQPGQTFYDDFVAMIHNSGCDPDVISGYIGESNMIAGTTAADTTTLLTTIHEDLLTEFPGAKLLQVLIHHLDTASASQANQDAVNQGILDLTTVVGRPDLRWIDALPEDALGLHLAGFAKLMASAGCMSTTTVATAFYPASDAPYASASDVRLNTDRGDGTLGTLEVPAEAEVEAGVQYGADGTEFTGTLEVGAAGGVSLIGGGLVH